MYLLGEQPAYADQLISRLQSIPAKLLDGLSPCGEPLHGFGSAGADGENRRRWTGPDLLDSYEAERRPVAEHNVTRSADPAGSRRPVDAELAAQSAIELCERTGSELHVVHVGEYLSTFYAYTEEEPAELRHTAQQLLDEQTERIRAASGQIAQAHLRLGRPAERRQRGRS